MIVTSKIIVANNNKKKFGIVTESPKGDTESQSD